ncbi:MAG: prepilin-type N-terminal cleavage/methylation domain-containing protein [Planctomycetota bacterium]|jgi:prepilin-type N-terminal cleavage/methylation domain-containing protein/prepilin-type processing-associated H-X9-DG protein
MRSTNRNAFTLIELLVVISVVTLLMAILVPALGAARSESRSLACKSNLRQLLLASIGYATEHDGSYVPAASDLWDRAGLNRWHGRRETRDDPFDPLRGPLAGYLADGKVKECAAKVDFVKGREWDANFEQGCGGYGYNMTYIGSRIWQGGTGSVQDWKDSYARTTRMAEVASPGETVMFADTAMSKDGMSLIEYSFIEPPFMVFDGRPATGFCLSPSIHFRHRDRANIGWADGHVDPRRMAAIDDVNVYGIRSADVNLGWFGPIDNTPFDLE